MILTESKALNLLKNESLVEILPSLAPLFEEFRAIEAQVKKKAKCQKCMLTEKEFQALRPRALAALCALPTDEMAKLKKFLVTAQITAFLADPATGKTSKVTL